MQLMMPHAYAVSSAKSNDSVKKCASNNSKLRILAAVILAHLYWCQMIKLRRGYMPALKNYSGIKQRMISRKVRLERNNLKMKTSHDQAL